MQYDACIYIYTVILFAVVRDINERGRKLDQVLEQYANLVKPAFEEFTLPVRWE